MSLKKITFHLTGAAPLLMHNGALADPLSEGAKAMKQLTGKRGKTDADHEQMALVEWTYSTYQNSAGRLVLPSDCIEAAFLNAARKLKLGKQAQAGAFCMEHAPLAFDGDTLTMKELWERGKNRFTKGVRVGQAKVMRTRFIIEDWTADVSLQYDDKMMNEEQAQQIMKIAGEQIGLCDWRPKFGRFQVR